MTYALKRSTLTSTMFEMELFRQVLRVERKARVGARAKHAKLAGVSQTTIQNAEMGPDVPGIDTVARLVEAMPGLTLKDFFGKIEGGQSLSDMSPDGVPLAGGTGDDALPQFQSQERIDQAVLRTLGRLAIAGLQEDAPARPTDYRLPPATRPLAAESSRHARKNRKRHVRPKKKRPKK